MIFTKDQLEKIQYDSKIIKSKVVVLLPGQPGVMIGTDDTVSYIKIIPYITDKPSIWCTTKDSVYFTASIPYMLEMIESSIDNTIDIPLMDNLKFNLLFGKIIKGYHYYSDIINRAPSTYYKDIHLNPDFMRTISVPASQGESCWHIDKNHSVYLYSGLVPVNKSDTVDLIIFEYPNTNNFVCKFIVNKGKKGVISVLMNPLRL